MKRLTAQGLVDMTPEEEAAIEAAGQAAETEASERVAMKADRQGVLSDNQVRAFLNKSPDQVAQTIDNNVTDLDSAKTAIKVLALVVSVLARREMNQ